MEPIRVISYEVSGSVATAFSVLSNVAAFLHSSVGSEINAFLQTLTPQTLNLMSQALCLQGRGRCSQIL